MINHEIVSKPDLSALHTLPLWFIVRTETANGNQTHAASSARVTLANSRAEVGHGRGRNGRYYFYRRTEDAETEVGAHLRYRAG